MKRGSSAPCRTLLSQNSSCSTNDGMRLLPADRLRTQEKTGAEQLHWPERVKLHSSPRSSRHTQLM